MTRKQIEGMDYIHLGAGWYSDEDDTMRIRLWRKDELDIWKWDNIQHENNQIVFRGTLTKIKDFKMVIICIHLIRITDKLILSLYHGSNYP